MKVSSNAGHGGSTALAPEAVTCIEAGALFRAHGIFVAGFLSRMGAAAADVDDLTQEVFLVAHRRGGYVTGPARPTTWLAEIALRVLSTHRRGRRRKPAEGAGDAIDRLPSEASATDERVGASLALARIQRCLDGIDDEHRAVFVLFELEGEPCSAIAAALDIPIGTVYSRLHHARKKLMDAWSAA